MEYNPSNGDIYIGRESTNNVSVIDSSPNMVIITIKVGDFPYSLEYNPSNENIYAANEGSVTVSVIDTLTNTLINTISVRDTPRDVEYNPLNNNIYVSNSRSNDVSVIQTVIPAPEEKSKTVSDLIKGIIQNPLDITNSINSANQIRDILIDDNRDNDQIVCNLIDSETEYT